MKKITALFVLIAPVWATTQDQVEIGPTHNSVTVRYGVETLPFDSSCTVTLADDGGTPIDTEVLTTGLSRRTAIFSSLTAETEYQIFIDCDGTVFDWVNGEVFTTSVDPGGGNVTVTIQTGAAPTITNVARATVEYDDNAAMSSSSTVQETDCASGCSIDISIPNGLHFFRWIWQDSGDATLVQGPVMSLNIGNSILRIAESEPPPQTVPIPELATWESNMLSFGATRCTNFAARTDEQNLGDTYYDAQRVYQQIRAYTSDASWDACIEDVQDSYRDYYVVPNGGNVPGYWNFTDGLTVDWTDNADATSKQAAIDLSESAAYCTDLTPLAWTESAALSREVAHCLIAMLNAESLGEVERARRDQMKDQILEHVDQWFITKDFVHAEGDPAACVGKYYYQPFMVGISMRALIKYWEETDDDDANVLAAIKLAADTTWTDAWVAADDSFWYQNCKDLPGDAWPAEPGAPDLNMLIAPAYAWLWEQGQGDAYRDKADEIFAGGVLGAYSDGSKQFNQNYLWSFEYVTIRTP